jgi:5-methylcytosine-specific restriction endonuclease McrA
VTPLAPERYKVQFTVTRETHDKLRRAQNLLRHSIPNVDPAAIFDRALTVLLGDLERAKCAATDRPRAARPAPWGSRHVPAAVKRAVWKRDGGQCAFVGAAGRCTERGFLEFHHVKPYADGGATVVENLELRCRAHNMYEAEQHFGVRLPLLVREVRDIPYCVPARSGPGESSFEILEHPDATDRLYDGKGQPAAADSELNQAYVGWNELVRAIELSHLKRLPDGAASIGIEPNGPHIEQPAPP